MKQVRSITMNPYAAGKRLVVGVSSNMWTFVDNVHMIAIVRELSRVNRTGEPSSND